MRQGQAVANRASALRGAGALAACAGLALLAACSKPQPADNAPFANGEWVDLTHALGPETVFWPTDGDFVHEENFHGHTDGGWFYSSYDLRLPEHGGTHLDAPEHFAEGRETADEVPLSRLIAPAAVVDVSEAALADRDYLFTVEDLAAWEAGNGQLPAGSILLFRTGYDRYWPDRESYMGTALRGAEGVAALHFPGLSPDLAQFLVDEREVAAVGLDTPSLDYGQSADFRVHRILLAQNIPGFENVANLGALPAWGATVVALPAKVRDGSGAPLRIVAFVPEGTPPPAR